jgi:hypothetical protein
MNYPVDRTDFKLFKHVTNEIDVYVKDQDRRPVNLLGKNLTINIVDDRAGTLIFQKSLAIVDEARGLMRLTTTPGETSQWEVGFLSFTVTFAREDGTEVLLYTDQNYGPRSFIEVIDGPVPPPVSSIIVPFSAFRGSSVGLLTYNVSSPYRASAQVGNNSGVQSIAAYTTNYSGKLWVQASLENQPPTQDNEWFNVALGSSTDYTQFTASTGIAAFTFRGSFMWVRFKTLDDFTTPPNGTFDQVLYRN